MQSKAEDVAEYLKEVPAERLFALTRLRKLCLEILIDYEESMVYGQPSYKNEGVVEVAFASDESYISLYILKKGVLKRHRSALTGLNIRRSCIRYPNPSKINFDLIRLLLTESFRSET
jgi:hypothetical protein